MFPQHLTTTKLHYTISIQPQYSTTTTTIHPHKSLQYHYIIMAVSLQFHYKVTTIYSFTAIS